MHQLQFIVATLYFLEYCLMNIIDLKWPKIWNSKENVEQFEKCFQVLANFSVNKNDFPEKLTEINNDTTQIILSTIESKYDDISKMFSYWAWWDLPSTFEEFKDLPLGSCQRNIGDILLQVERNNVFNTYENGWSKDTSVLQILKGMKTPSKLYKIPKEKLMSRINNISDSSKITDIQMKNFWRFLEIVDTDWLLSQEKTWIVARICWSITDVQKFHEYLMIQEKLPFGFQGTMEAFIDLPWLSAKCIAWIVNDQEYWTGDLSEISNFDDFKITFFCEVLSYIYDLEKKPSQTCFKKMWIFSKTYAFLNEVDGPKLQDLINNMISIRWLSKDRVIDNLLQTLKLEWQNYKSEQKMSLSTSINANNWFNELLNLRKTQWVSQAWSHFNIFSALSLSWWSIQLATSIYNQELDLLAWHSQRDSINNFNKLYLIDHWLSDKLRKIYSWLEFPHKLQDIVVSLHTDKLSKLLLNMNTWVERLWDLRSSMRDKEFFTELVNTSDPHMLLKLATLIESVDKWSKTTDLFHDWVLNWILVLDEKWLDNLIYALNNKEKTSYRGSILGKSSKAIFLNNLEKNLNYKELENCIQVVDQLNHPDLFAKYISRLQKVDSKYSDHWVHTLNHLSIRWLERLVKIVKTVWFDVLNNILLKQDNVLVDSVEYTQNIPDFCDFLLKYDAKHVISVLSSEDKRVFESYDTVLADLFDVK